MLVGPPHRGHHPGRSYRTGPDIRRQTPAVGGHTLNEALTEAFAVDSASRHLDVAIDHHRRAILGPDVQIGATQRADDAGLSDRGRDHGGHRSIDRVTSVRQRNQAGLGGGRIGCGNGGSAGHPAILPYTWGG